MYFESTHVFCEPKFNIDSRIAEFYNTITSSFYLWAAVVGATLTLGKSKKPNRYWTLCAAWACLVAIGVGSAVFHARLTFETQMCDEVSMIAFVVVLLVGKRECVGCGPHQIHARSGVWALSGATLLGALLYVATREYVVFVVTFTLAVVAEVTVSSLIRDFSTQKSRRCLKNATLLIALGGLVWGCESCFCKTHPWVWVLHSVWHALSALSAYFAVMHVYRFK